MGIIPKPKKDLNTLTTHEREKELSRLRNETEELIEEMGQKSDKKSLPTVKKYQKDREDSQKFQQYLDIKELKLLSRNKVRYQRYLILILKRFILEENLPKKYSYQIESNDEGIVLQIAGTDFTGAFKVCGIPFYDLFACKTLATKLGNTIGKIEGNFQKTKSGIIVAGEKDLQFIKKQDGRTN